jgi:hypothetical protein
LTRNPPDRSRLRRVLKGALAVGLMVGAVLVGVVVGVLVWLTTTGGNEFIRGQIETWGTEVGLASGQVKVERVNTNLDSSLEIEGVRVVAPDGREIIGVSRLAAEFRLRRLLQGELPIARVRVERPFLDVTVDGDGVSDLTRLFGESEPSAGPSEPFGGLPIKLQVGEIAIEDGRFTWATPDARWALEDIDLSLAAAGRARQIRLDKIDLSAALTSHDDLPLTLTGGVAYLDGDVELRPTQLGVGGSSLEVGGVITAAETAPALEMYLSLPKLRTDDIEQIAGDLGLAGDLGGTLRIAGPMSELVVEGKVDFPEGRTRASVMADLTAEPLRWSVSLEPEELLLGAFVEAITEPVVLDGSLSLSGAGTSWPDDLSGEGALTLNEPVIWGYHLDRIGAGLEIRDGALNLVNLGVGMPWVSATGGGALTETGVDLDLSLSISDLGGLSEFGAEGLYGRSEISGALAVDWSGEAAETRFNGRLYGGGMTLPGNVTVNDISGPFSLLVDGAGTMASGTAEAHAIAVGSMYIDELRSPWRVNVLDNGTLVWDLNPLVWGLDIAGVPIARAAGGDMVGRLPPGGGPVATLTLDFEQLIPDYYNWGRGTLTADMDGDLVTIDLDIQDSEQNIFAFNGQMNTTTLDVWITDFDFAPNEGARWRSEGEVKMSLVDDGMVSDPLVIRSEAGSLELGGRFVTAGELDAVVTIKEFDLEWLGRFVPSVAEGWEGLVELQLALAGTGGAPELSGFAAVKELVLPEKVNKLNARVYFDSVPGGFKVRGWGGPLKEDGKIQRVMAMEGTIPADMDFSSPKLHLDKPISAEWILAPTDFSTFTERLPAVGELPDARASAHFTVGGTFLEPEVDASFSVKVPFGEGIPAMDIDGQLAYAGDKIGFSAVGKNLNQRRLDIQGEATTRLPEVIAWALGESDVEPDMDDLNLFADNLNVRVIPLGIQLSSLASLAGLPLDIDGRLSGGLALRGSPMDPKLYMGLLITEGAVGKVAVSAPSFALKPVDGGYEFNSWFTFTPTQGEGEDKLETGPAGELKITASIPLDLSGGAPDIDAELARPGLDVKIEGLNIPMSLISALDPDVRDAEGTLSVVGGVTGSASAPSVDLDLDIAETGFFYAPVGVRFDDLELSAAVEPGRLNLKRFSVTTTPRRSRSTLDDNSGTIRASGRVGLKENTPDTVKVIVSASEAWVIDTREMAIQISGDAALTGTWPELALEGEIATNTARVKLGESFWLGEQTLMLDPSIQVVRGEYDAPAPMGPRPPEFWERWLIDLDLDIVPQTARLDVAIPIDASYGKVSAALSTVELDSWLEGLLHLNIDHGAMAMTGEIETRRGESKVFGKEFDLDEGVISFAGDLEDPILDITAVHRTQKYGDITANIGGSASEIKLGFESSETWSETDVASILLLGMPASELSQSQGGSGMSLVNAAVSMMGQAAADAGVMGTLDMLEVEGSSDSESGASISSIRAGRALSEKLFLIVGLDFDAEEQENTTEATIEWLISRQIFAEFVTGDAGESSVDVYTRWRF